MSAVEIKNKLANGEISKEEAERMFQELHGVKGEVIAIRPKANGFNSIMVKAQYVFNHEMAYEHYLDRKDLEEGIKHGIGLVAFGVTGIVDGVAEGCVYAFSEVAETAAFAVSRTGNRVKDGWLRGKNDQG